MFSVYVGVTFDQMLGEDGMSAQVGVRDCAFVNATNPDGESCEFAIVAADEWQGKGVARKLMGVLIEAARARGIKYMNGDFLSENTRMIRFVTTLGFVLSAHPEDAGLKRGVLALD